jgi:hypothetical protein
MSTVSTLWKADLDIFAPLGVGPELLEAQGICRVTDAEARASWGIRYRADAVLSGIIFPYFDPVSEYRVTARLRRDCPEVDRDGKPKGKYLCPYGDRRHLYFPRGSGRLLADAAVTVVLVEAEKSALALTALSSRSGRPLLAIATGGCWGWRAKVGFTTGPDGTRQEITGALPDLQLMNWATDRKCIVLFDANAATNPQVQAARRALVEELATYGKHSHC